MMSTLKTIEKQCKSIDACTAFLFSPFYLYQTFLSICAEDVALTDNETLVAKLPTLANKSASILNEARID